MPSQPSAAALASNAPSAVELNDLLAHTALYAKVTCEILRDMFGVRADVVGEPVEDPRFHTDKQLTAAILYTGPIHGEYLLAGEAETLAKIVDVKAITPETLRARAGEFFDPLCEALNASVGTSIEELSEDYPHLTFASPRLLCGPAHYPRIPTGRVVVRTDHGEIECHFYINMQKLDLAANYQAALQAKRSAIVRAERKQQTIDRIMANITSSIFTIDRELRILPGMTGSTRRMLQISEQPASQGWEFAKIMGNIWGDRAGVRRLISWLHMAFSVTNDLQWYRQAANRSTWDQITTRNGRQLRFRWVPLRQEDGQIDRVMVIAEDVTSTSPIAAEQRFVQNSNEASLTLLGRLLDLRVDDVVSFVEDSCHANALANMLGKAASHIKQELHELRELLETGFDAANGPNTGNLELQQLRETVERTVNYIDALPFDHEDRVQTLVRAELALCRGNAVRVDVKRLDEATTVAKRLVKDYAPARTLLDRLQALKMRHVFDGFSVLHVMCERLADAGGVALQLRHIGDAVVGVETHRTILQALVYLLRNAVEFCMEPRESDDPRPRSSKGTIVVSTRELDDMVSVMVRDDGGQFDGALQPLTLVRSPVAPRSKHQVNLSPQERIDRAEKLVKQAGGTLSVVREGLGETIAEMRLPRGC